MHIAEANSCFSLHQSQGIVTDISVSDVRSVMEAGWLSARGGSSV